MTALRDGAPIRCVCTNGCFFEEQLEHTVVVRALIRQDLQHIPVLDDFSIIIQPKDIDTGIFQSLGPNLVAMQNDVLTVYKRTFHLNALAGILLGHLLEISDECILAVPYMRIVLDVLRASICGDRVSGAAIVEHHLIERDDIGFVGFRSSLQGESSLIGRAPSIR